MKAHQEKTAEMLALREIRMLKASVHPNVVHLHKAFRSKSGRIYMVMEHVQHTLTEQLRRNPSGISSQSVKLITWQLLQATAYLHSNKVLRNNKASDSSSVLACQHYCSDDFNSGKEPKEATGSVHYF